MTDDVDRASEREGEILTEALYQQARRAGLAGKTVADSAKRCHDCDDPIPQARRAAVPGCQLCVACQGAHERTRP
ncbi:MAG: TraR/DksA C4-type zinc finger protein [Hydrogenophaga sp.]|nr:TraR/DksA C4-type zinc finger protein [Hydrogenophaga sp.]MDZ4128010.1 TraR/DksA C4-type zinc finger protein [Hydrogenophaga sp.]